MGQIGQNNNEEGVWNWLKVDIWIQIYRLSQVDSLLFCLCFFEGEREKRGAEECWGSKQLTPV